MGPQEHPGRQQQRVILVKLGELGVAPIVGPHVQPGSSEMVRSLFQICAGVPPAGMPGEPAIGWVLALAFRPPEACECGGLACLRRCAQGLCSSVGS